MQDPNGDAELTGRYPGQAAAHRPVGDLDIESRGVQHRGGGMRDVRVEVVVEGVGPQHDSPAAATGGFGTICLGEAGRRERGEGAPGVDTGGAGGDPGEARRVGERIHRARRRGGRTGPQRQPSHRVVGQRTRPVPVVVVEELGLVGGHVDADGAVPFASLAGQAQIQGVADRGRAPAVGDDVPLDHLEQKPCPAAGGVLLLAGGPVAGAHHAGFVAPALTDTDAPRRGPAEAVVVLTVGEPRRRFPR
ncbi:hypothetical protein DEU38_11536 [Rhodococcus sp. AG1013]|nr:hypothetical protein DEU38_11536 [Rhodococcus sp. AG1013]